jgi:hypothetical protein
MSKRAANDNIDEVWRQLQAQGYAVYSKAAVDEEQKNQRCAPSLVLVLALPKELGISPMESSFAYESFELEIGHDEART